MKNIVELRGNLCSLWDKTLNKEVDYKEAKELANIAGKIIGTVGVQLKGHEINKTSHNIRFLRDEDGNE